MNVFHDLYEIINKYINKLNSFTSTLNTFVATGSSIM